MSEVGRIKSLDIWRGLAILGMVVYHFLFFMDMQGLISFDFNSLGMEVFARIVQFSFLGLVGVAMSIVYRRKTLDEFRYFQFFRVAEIAVWAIAFTLISYLMYQDMFIRFGILHLIATSIFIITLFANRKLALIFLVMAVLFTWLGGYSGRILEHNYFSFVGLYSNSFGSYDFFPLVPWLMVPIIGYLIGDWLTDALRKADNYLPKFRWLQLLGRNSLKVYVLHFPIVFGVVYLIDML